MILSIDFFVITLLCWCAVGVGQPTEPINKTAFKKPRLPRPASLDVSGSRRNYSRLFPPVPRGLKGRAAELRTLGQTITAAAPTRLALVGSGGSGKSMLAASLGHRLEAFFGGRIEWFRVGAWDFPTLTEMLALRFGTERAEDSAGRA